MDVDLNAIITTQVARDILDRIPEKKKVEMVEAMVVEGLQRHTVKYTVSKALEGMCEEMAIEYAARPENRERARKAAEAAVDTFIDEVLGDKVLTHLREGLTLSYRDMFGVKK